MRIWLTALMLALTAAPACARDYRAGDVWFYHVRPGDPDSLLRIQAVEEGPVPGDPAGRIYHVSLVGVHFGDDPAPRDVAHLPVSRATLDASLTRISPAAIGFPDWREGAAQWRAARGGVFTISIAEILDIVERTLHQSPGSDPEAGPGS
jgi:hypothetical protein